ncbi:MAG: polymer-forming cytoskeletal protein [Pseudorhodoplanes sp.]|nr:polymer-forming cytoskeletal protein [Pseudorhodoplanes sp.]
MSDYVSGKTEGAENSCAFFGEGVTFKGSITAPERIVVHGTVEGDLIARDLLVGPTGTIKGNVKVDQADIQGKVLQNIEARVCLSLRKTGRIEGSAVYGDIEIEKGGVLAGEVSSIKGAEKGGDAAKKADNNGGRVGAPPIAFDTIRSVASSNEPKREDADRATANKK